MRDGAPGRRVTIIAGALALGLALGASHAVVADKAAAPRDSLVLYIPLAENLSPLYLPLVLNQANEPVNLQNSSFESDTVLDWVHNPVCYYDDPLRVLTDPQGNQHPRGWGFYSTPAGGLMPFPTKMQQGQVVPAISSGPGEYVHKGWCQLPENERHGWPRALIIDGSWTYKAFRYGNPQALVLSQVLTGTPGLRLEVTGYILGESPDTPSGPKLEDDHFIASVQLGNLQDKRLYASMIHHNDVPGNERHWNKYDLTVIVPPSGQLPLTIIVQQNWLGETDFFIDAFQAVEWFAP